MTERSLFWRRHLEAIDAEGISTSAYARREGLALGLLYQWRRKLADSVDHAIGPTNASSSFVAVRVTESLRSIPKDWTLRLNGIELSFPNQPDPAWVADLLLALQNGHQHASRP